MTIHDPDDRWSGESGRLAAEVDPPPGLEDRVAATLVQRGLIAPGNRRAPAWSLMRGALAAAASVALVALGYLAGQAASPGTLTGAETDLYALLLLETPGYDAPSGAEAVDRYSEYSQWVAQARQRRQFVTGEDLETGRGWVLEPGQPARRVPVAAVTGAPPLSGLFFVRADGPEQALELAAELPHLRHGGAVLVQKTLRTDQPPEAGP